MIRIYLIGIGNCAVIQVLIEMKIGTRASGQKQSKTLQGKNKSTAVLRSIRPPPPPPPSIMLVVVFIYTLITPFIPISGCQASRLIYRLNSALENGACRLGAVVNLDFGAWRVFSRSLGLYYTKRSYSNFSYSLARISRNMCCSLKWLSFRDIRLPT